MLKLYFGLDGVFFSRKAEDQNNIVSPFHNLHLLQKYPTTLTPSRYFLQIYKSPSTHPPTYEKFLQKVLQKPQEFQDFFNLQLEVYFLNVIFGHEIAEFKKAMKSLISQI